MPLSAYGAAGEAYGDGTYYGAGGPSPSGRRVVRSPRYGLTRVASFLLSLLRTLHG